MRPLSTTSDGPGSQGTCRMRQSDACSRSVSSSSSSSAILGIFSAERERPKAPTPELSSPADLNFLVRQSIACLAGLEPYGRSLLTSRSKLGMRRLNWFDEVRGPSGACCMTVEGGCEDWPEDFSGRCRRRCVTSRHRRAPRDIKEGVRHRRPGPVAHRTVGRIAISATACRPAGGATGGHRDRHAPAPWRFHMPNGASTATAAMASRSAGASSSANPPSSIAPGSSASSRRSLRGQAASWKITPSVWRWPECSRLTP